MQNDYLRDADWLSGDLVEFFLSMLLRSGDFSRHWFVTIIGSAGWLKRTDGHKNTATGMRMRRRGV